MTGKEFSELSQDYYRIEKAISYLEENYLLQPDLDAIAERIHLSKYHFHRLFKRWAGITPIQFQKYLTLDYAKKKLLEGRSVLDTTLETGLSSPGRLHDLFVSFDAVTPGEYKSRGAVLTIEYGYVPTPFGSCLLGITTRGICHLSFHDAETASAPVVLLRKSWPSAELLENSSKAGVILQEIFKPAGWNEAEPFHLYVKGTNFQVKVWKALVSIPAGTMVSYKDVAAYSGSPRSVRAAAGVVAANPVALLIPCHRVITAAGKIHRYRWGAERKRLILAREAFVAARSSGELYETA
ncbi:MAG: methylated-DNA--[protein]-cysteine S-methyltransferase [Spirochaeta sp.]|nr:methylated-DNA--[protein]-cysteine S-methyltransferase [Spirochaeta sp.]